VAADKMGLDDLWVLDHMAIPPDDAEGSGGRYVDPLATLAFAAGITESVRLGVSVLIAPYRAPLPTAKWLASIQELAAGRLCAGFGVGWMAAEFKALGIDRQRRGAITDETLEVILACFAADIDWWCRGKCVTESDQIWRRLDAEQSGSRRITEPRRGTQVRHVRRR
jgi:alkanesulfonate monooxygenase SsuD/methylene tetrahydromethanopterin reductase-like flavin-dependent oxidoreductase (luciferase family)